MNNLVFVQNKKVVTDSLIVAEVFEKAHDKVLRDIRNLGCSEEFRLANFGESTYLNSQNKEMPMYFMNQKGFTLLVMGYTGKEAMKFKEQYINEFERMENELKSPKLLSEREQLIAAMKISIETAEEIAVMKDEMAEIKQQVTNQITLDHGQQVSLHHQLKKRVERLAEGLEDKEKRAMYSQIHSHLRRAFAAPTYRVVKKKDFEEAMNWVKAWRPLI